MDKEFWYAVQAGGVVGALGGFIGDWLWAGLIGGAFCGVVLSLETLLKRVINQE
jgi:hypothetical protein